MEKITAPLKVSKLLKYIVNLIVVILCWTCANCAVLIPFGKSNGSCLSFCVASENVGCDPGHAVFRRKGTFFVYHLLTKYGSPFHITYWDLCILNCWKYSLKIVNKALKWEILRLFQSHKILLFAFLGRFYWPKWQISPDSSPVVSHY